MLNKIYLNRFLDILSKMIEISKNNNDIDVCIKYIEVYKTKLDDIIYNELFRYTTRNYLDTIIEQLENEKHTKT